MAALPNFWPSENIKVKKKDEFICKVYGINMEYLENGFEIDRFRCFLAQFVATLYLINFGHICIGILVVIILISIFGRIKENYRWFILNQALWDLFVTYSFICDNTTAVSIFEKRQGSTCFYNGRGLEYNYFISEFIPTNPYSAILLLSFTRFLCLYFMNLYEKLTRNRRILYLIILFNAIVFFVHINRLFGFLVRIKEEELLLNCYKQQRKLKLPKDACMYKTLTDFWLEFYTFFYKVFNGIVFIKPVLCILLSMFAAIAIIFRIGKQAKFQIKHNRRDFFNSLRISLVILLQTLINFLVFSIEFTKNFQELLLSTFNIPFKSTAKEINFFFPCDNCLDFRLPLWLDGNYGLTYYTVRQAIIQLRVFIESIIVLFIMTGYREAIINFVKFIYMAIRYRGKEDSTFFKKTATSRSKTSGQRSKVSSSSHK